MIVGPEGMKAEVSGEWGKSEIASKTIDTVRSRENVLPASYIVKGDIEWLIACGLTLTPLASTGHPANSPTDRRTREKTCEVDGSLDAKTTEADKALVKDREDVRLTLATIVVSRFTRYRARLTSFLQQAYHTVTDYFFVCDALQPVFASATDATWRPGRY